MLLAYCLQKKVFSKKYWNTEKSSRVKTVILTVLQLSFFLIIEGTGKNLFAVNLLN